MSINSNWVAAVKEDIPSERPLYAITPISKYIERFPTTRYYGSKRKLLPWIYECVKSLQFKTVLDAFGGTGSVSQLFRAMRKSVFYHDAFKFNADIAGAVLTNGASISRSDLLRLLDSVELTQGTVANSFDGIFFLDVENRWIDGFMKTVVAAGVPAADESLLKYLMYQACLKKRPFNLFHRSNLQLRTRTDVHRSFGNATTWERSFREHMLECFDELMASRDATLPPATIIPPGNVSSLEAGYDLVYLDPPYVVSSDRRNRDDYWRRYHFLEGLANYSKWNERIDWSSQIRQMSAPKHFTEWSRFQRFQEQLFALIESHRKSIVVLSYVKNAHPEDEVIRAFFEATFSRVSVHSTEHGHALSATRKRELLFIGSPR
ncbi:DNA adenine methylase [Rhizobium leguminosarum]|uniref:DNA adenine methylase n=1 Tax=Rhizobium TaxID=379 RepID=UPI00140FA683|nr:DNA adenine methylase [Rhizobium leguminosarum]QIO69334.1 adenine methyltransferase [Rhizobium leguminosarum bv. trifolii]